MIMNYALQSAFRSALRGPFDAAGSGFDIASLYAGGQKGAWYQTNDFSTLYQDVALTVPVTAVGQTVKGIKDKSGNGNHATNAAGWVLGSDASGNYLQAVSSSQFLTAAFNFSSSSFSLWAKTEQGPDYQTSIVSFGNIGSVTGSFDFGYYGGALLYRRGSGAVGSRGAPQVSGVIVTSVTCDLSGTTQNTECAALRVNGTQPVLTDYGSGDTGGGPFSTQSLSLGGVGAAPYFRGKLYELVFVNEVRTLLDVEAKLRNTDPPTPAFTPLNFADTGDQPTINNQYQQTSAYAHADYQTTATSAIVSTYNDIYSSYPSFAAIGVHINGVWNQTIQLTSMGSQSSAIVLPAGDKKVSFTNSGQSKPSTLIGAYVNGVTGNAPLTAITPAPVNRVLIYGDSIASGGNATAPTTEAWVVLVRAAYYPKSLATEVWGYRALADDASTPTDRSAFVSKLVAYSPARIWLAIGTNDYGLNKWTAAAFGSAYTSLLDDLHAALPSALIFAQTPLVRSSEAANSSGSTLGDYRTQITLAQLSRSSYVTLVDGAAILTTSDLADGVHPTTAGHAKYATAVRSVLGI